MGKMVPQSLELWFKNFSCKLYTLKWGHVTLQSFCNTLDSSVDHLWESSSGMSNLHPPKVLPTFDVDLKHVEHVSGYMFWQTEYCGVLSNKRGSLPGEPSGPCTMCVRQEYSAISTCYNTWSIGPGGVSHTNVKVRAYILAGVMLPCKQHFSSS